MSVLWNPKLRYWSMLRTHTEIRFSQPPSTAFGRPSPRTSNKPELPMQMQEKETQARILSASPSRFLPPPPQPSPQTCPLLGRAQGRLISPKVVTDQFSKLHENRKQTENQIHQSLSLENSLAGRSNVLTISCCFKSF